MGLEYESWPGAAAAEAERRIAFVLAQQHISPWLKDALRSALACDPIVAANDAEMLRLLLRWRTNAVMFAMLSPSPPQSAQSDARE